MRSVSLTTLTEYKVNRDCNTCNVRYINAFMDVDLHFNHQSINYGLPTAIVPLDSLTVAPAVQSLAVRRNCFTDSRLGHTVDTVRVRVAWRLVRFLVVAPHATAGSHFCTPVALQRRTLSRQVRKLLF